MVFHFVGVLSLAVVSAILNRKYAAALGCVASASGGDDTSDADLLVIIHKVVPKVGFGWTVCVIGFVALWSTDDPSPETH